jgi:O-methyltransferase involved in polyketide biosynthesis
MQPEKVRLSKEKETLLITLYCRALHSRSKDPVLRDRWAEDAVGLIDYDFGKLRVSRYDPLSIAVRARKFDLLTTRYLADSPEATVLHLGCGLDSRVFRVDPPARVPWFDVDYPEVIELRRHLYPERAGCRLIGSSLADLSWLEEVPGDRPALVVAEGVTMYLTEEVVKPLLNRLTDHFPGGQMAFDAHSRRLVRWVARLGASVKGTGASFGWGIDAPRDVKKLEPRLDPVAEFRTPDLAEYPRMPLTMRLLVRVMDLIPLLRGMNRVLLYRFGAERDRHGR